MKKVPELVGNFKVVLEAPQSFYFQLDSFSCVSQVSLSALFTDHVALVCFLHATVVEK